MPEKVKRLKALQEDVIKQGLCTGCGACLNRCPYITMYEGRIVVLDKCTIEEGDCYKLCPRTSTDMNKLSEKIFGFPYSNEEVGHYLDIYMVRSKDKKIRNRAQDGGTVTTLLAFALDQGIIDAVVCTKMDQEKLPHGYLARTKDELLQCAGSSYETSFSLQSYKNISKENSENLGIVGLGCQTEALAKIKADTPKNSVHPGHIKLTIGLFCGWALRSDIFHPYLKEICDLSQTVRFDIPHSPHYTFEIYSKSKTKSVSLDEIRPYINPACKYCWNLTAEFSDISVGSAGSTFPGWNTVIIRSKMGADLIELAKKMQLLEARALPDERRSHLKAVALKRKKAAFKNIVEKSGSKKDLLYVSGLSQEITDQILETK
jgi:coenzyme F420 hydrogenase subunit beta